MKASEIAILKNQIKAACECMHYYFQLKKNADTDKDFTNCQKYQLAYTGSLEAFNALKEFAELVGLGGVVYEIEKEVWDEKDN